MKIQIQTYIILDLSVILRKHIHFIQCKFHDRRILLRGFPPAVGQVAHGLGNFSCRCSEELKLLKTLDFSQRLIRLWRKSRVEDADRKKFTCEWRGL
jgi:hypothetical protein